MMLVLEFFQGAITVDQYLAMDEESLAAAIRLMNVRAQQQQRG